MRHDVYLGSFKIIVDDSSQHPRHARYSDECFTHEIVRIDGIAFSERMIAREHHDERLLCYQLVFKVGLLFPTEKSDIKSPALEVVCKHCGMVARNSDFDIEQFVSKDGCGTRQPVDLLSGLEPHGESRLDRLRGSPRCVCGTLGLGDAHACGVE